MNIEPLESRIAPATFVVANRLDDHNGGTLREAVEMANADPLTADTITFLPNAYGEILLLTAIPIKGPVKIKGPGADKISVSGHNQTRAFYIDDGDPAQQSAVSISGLGIVGGAGGTNGGAIVCFEPLALSKVTVSGGSVSTNGGGVCVNAVGNVSITDSKILGNVTDFIGGGLYIEATGKVSISGSAILGNKATYGVGGLFVSAGGGIVISKTVIADNEDNNASYGGAGARLEGTISLDHVSVLRNRTLGDGGGLYVDGSTTIKNSLISGNHSDRDGGGLERVDGSLTVTNTIFSGNSARGGGGFHSVVIGTTTFSKDTFVHNTASDATYGGGAIFTQNNDLNITGSRFLGNSSAGDGGAIWNALGAVNLQVSKSFFEGNTAEKSGGAIAIDRASTLTLTGDVFSGNRASTDGGALFATNASVITIKGGSFLDNKAVFDGGAIAAKALASGEVPSINATGVLFQRNASGSNGGAVLLEDGGISSFKTSRFLDNLAGSVGGAIDFTYIVSRGGTLDIVGSLFRGDFAGLGGALFLEGTGSVSVTSSSFFENVASLTAGTGGAISVKDLTVALSKVIISRNVAYQGGGIDNFAGTVSISADSKIFGNFATIGPDTSGI